MKTFQVAEVDTHRRGKQKGGEWAINDFTLRCYGELPVKKNDDGSYLISLSPPRQLRLEWKRANMSEPKDGEVIHLGVQRLTLRNLLGLRILQRDKVRNRIAQQNAGERELKMAVRSRACSTIQLLPRR